jgi:dTMP kinase
MIITFEGGEGVGKSTHVNFLCSYLEQKGLAWLSLREPGGSPVSEELRHLCLKNEMDIITELLLMLASRRENICNLIQPAIDHGEIVILDRFIDSTFVYQGIAGGLGKAFVLDLMKRTNTYLEPDLTFILDLPASQALKRIKPSDKFERQPLEFHEKIREGFLDLANDKTNKRFHLIDTSKTKEKNKEEIIAIVDEKLR